MTVAINRGDVSLLIKSLISRNISPGGSNSTAHLLGLFPSLYRTDFGEIRLADASDRFCPWHSLIYAHVQRLPFRFFSDCKCLLCCVIHRTRDNSDGLAYRFHK